MNAIFMFLLIGLFSGNSVNGGEKAQKVALDNSYKIENISGKAAFQSEKLISHLVGNKGKKALRRIKKIEAQVDKVLTLAKKLQDVSNADRNEKQAGTLGGIECGTSFILVHAEFARRSLLIVKNAFQTKDLLKAGEAAAALHNSFSRIRALSRSIILELVQGPEPVLGHAV